MTSRSCKAMRPLLSAYLDGELSPADQARLQAHLAECAECRAVLASYQDMRQRLHQLPPTPLPPGLHQDIRAALEQERRRPHRFRLAVSPVAFAFALGLILLLAGTLLYSQALPPSVVSAEPAPNTTWPFYRPITITFTKPMDEASVASHLRISPAGERERLPISWRGTTLVIGASADQQTPLLPDTVYTVAILHGARDRWGHELQQDWTLTFRTSSAIAAAPSPSPPASPSPAATQPAATAPPATPDPTPSPLASAATPLPTATPAPVTATPAAPAPPVQASSRPTAPVASPAPASSPGTSTAVSSSTGSVSQESHTPVSSAAPPPPATPATPAASTTPVAATSPVATAVASPTPLPSPTPAETATPATTPTPASTPQPTATVQPTPVTGAFAQVYWGDQNVQKLLGNPTGLAYTVAASELAFQRGVMVERIDTGTFYILKDDGSWVSVPVPTDQGDPANQAQSNLWVPGGKYGVVWKAEQLLDSIGYATEAAPHVMAQGARIQPFEHGILLLSDRGFVYMLLTNGSWAQFPVTGN